MNMQRISTILLSLIAGTALAVTSLYAQLSEAEKLYQSGVYQLEAVGDFDEAITIFNRVVKEHASNKLISGKALLKIGLCYERLGSQKASEAYERILRQYADQGELVAQARARLAALRQQSEDQAQSVQLSFGDEDAQALSVSPDGSLATLLDFTIGQNIAVYDLTSKKKRLVTRYHWAESPDDGWTAGTAWSPDGKEIAYFKGDFAAGGPGQLWATTLDGTSRLLLKRDAASIAPCDWLDDGSGIVVMLKDSTGYTLGIVPASGGSLKTLRTFDEGALNLSMLYAVASASPDGRFIVFEEGPKGARNIMIISRDGKRLTAVTDDPADDAQPFWSPDGGHVIFKSNRHGSWALWGVAVNDGIPDRTPFMIASGFDDTQLLGWSQAGLTYMRTIVLIDIFRMPVDPSSCKPTGMAQQIQYTPTGSNIFPVWSPDGRQFAFVSNRGGLSSPGYMVIMSAAGGRPREFKIPMTYTYWTYYFRDLRWTPDGKVLTFSGQDSSGKPVLYLLTPDSGKWDMRPLAGVGGGTKIEWAGNGQSYFCVLGGRGIVKREINSSDEEYIYKTPKESKGVYQNLRVSRDYKWLAFLEDNTRLVTVELATGKSSVMSPPGYYFLNWCSDSRRMVVIRRVNKTSEFYTIGIDGTNPVKIDFAGSLPKGITLGSPDWSPDGSEIVFASGPKWIFEHNLLKTVIPKGR